MKLQLSSTNTLVGLYSAEEELISPLFDCASEGSYCTYLPIVGNAEVNELFTGKPGISYYYADSQRIAMRTGGEAYLLFGDHLGSSSLLVKADGTIAEKAYYLPWGGTRGEETITSTDYGYTGQMREGDIYYYGARWYDPTIGRFMQADTIVPLQVQGTQAFDRYAYVNNNPLRYTDPSGNYACDVNGDCVIESWNNSFIIQQSQNRCGYASMAMAVSVVTGNQTSEQDILYYFPESNIKFFGNNMGILPGRLTNVINDNMYDKVLAELDRNGNFAKIDENLRNDKPTILLHAWDKWRFAGHYILIIGKSQKHGYIFADPGNSGSLIYEDQYFAKWAKSVNGSSNFEDFWANSNIFVRSYRMITLSERKVFFPIFKGNPYYSNKEQTQ